MTSLLETNGPIAPPFSFNHPNVARFSPEVTGRIILKSVTERLGWSSLSSKRILDYGCGVRLAATIYNLEIDVALYAGVDVNRTAIAWLNDNIAYPQFRFEHLDMHNQMYNPGGVICGPSVLRDRGLSDFDVACMFSVITHQHPPDAELIFSMLRPCAARLYFTAFVDDQIDGYVEGTPENPRLVSTYSTAFLTEILTRTGWRVDAIHAKSPDRLFQMTAVVCT